MAIALAFVPVQSVEAQIRPDRNAIAADLTEGSTQERIAAVAVIREIPMGERGPLIRTALGQELTRYAAYLEQRRQAILSGQPLDPPTDHGEYLFNVLDLLIEYRDPADLASLVLFVNTGNRVLDAIAAFGEQAVEPLMVVVSDPEADQSRVSSALLALNRIMRDQAQLVSTGAKRRIIDATHQRLRGVQAPAVVLAAIDLAVVTGDQGLRGRVEALSENPGLIQDLGITDAEGLLELVRRRAAAALRTREPA